MDIIISILFLAFEVWRDYRQFKNEGKISHWVGWVVRLLCVIVLIASSNGLGILFYAGIFTGTFSFIMGYLITGNPFHIGDTSWWDRTSLKLLKVPLAVYSMRIILALTLIGSYVWPVYWVELYYEILAWLSL